MNDLTERQQQVLDFIRAFSRRTGYPPTVREIGRELKLSSPSTVHVHLANLERRGLIRRDPSKPRALELVTDVRPARPLPLVGQVAAGQPILAEQNIEDYVQVPSFLRLSDDDFLLRVDDHPDPVAEVRRLYTVAAEGEDGEFLRLQMRLSSVAGSYEGP